MSEPVITGMAVDLETNTLHVQLDADRALVAGATARRRRGTIEIGTGGKLVGVEVGEHYVVVMEPEAGAEGLIRSMEVEVEVLTRQDSDDPVEIIIPRRGTGYEIAWPSGNQ